MIYKVNYRLSAKENLHRILKKAIPVEYAISKLFNEEKMNILDEDEEAAILISRVEIYLCMYDTPPCLEMYFNATCIRNIYLKENEVNTDIVNRYFKNFVKNRKK